MSIYDDLVPASTSQTPASPAPAIPAMPALSATPRSSPALPSPSIKTTSSTPAVKTPVVASPRVAPSVAPTPVTPTPAAKTSKTIYDDLVPASTPSSDTSTTNPAKTKTIYDDLVPKEKPVPTPYFSSVDKEGNSIGFSDEKDVSGKPFVAYRNPGDTATTTDKTRVATTFDPRTPQKLDSKILQNGRMPQSASTELRKELGAGYSDELDHRISLELSGSNDRSNLGLEPDVLGTKNTATDPLENSLARDVAAGKMSLWDAQIKLAQAKGITVPWTAQAKSPSFWDKIKGVVSTAGSDISNTIESVKNHFIGTPAQSEQPTSPDDFKSQVTSTFPFTANAKAIIDKTPVALGDPSNRNAPAQTEYGKDNVPSQILINGMKSPGDQLNLAHEFFNTIFSHDKIDPVAFNKAWDQALKSKDENAPVLNSIDAKNLNAPINASVFKEKDGENINNPFYLATERFAFAGSMLGVDGISALPKSLQPFYKNYIGDYSAEPKNSEQTSNGQMPKFSATPNGPALPEAKTNISDTTPQKSKDTTPGIVDKAITGTVEGAKYLQDKFIDTAANIVAPGTTKEQARDPQYWKDLGVNLPGGALDMGTYLAEHPVKAAMDIVGGATRGLTKSVTNIIINNFVDKDVRPYEQQEIQNILDKYINVGSSPLEQGFENAGGAAPIIAAGAEGGAIAGAAGATAGFLGTGQATLPREATIKERADQAMSDLVALGIFKVGSDAYSGAKTSVTDAVAKSYDLYKSIPGKEGGYIKNPLASSDANEPGKSEPAKPEEKPSTVYRYQGGKNGELNKALEKNGVPTVGEGHYYAEKPGGEATEFGSNQTAHEVPSDLKLYDTVPTSKGDAFTGFSNDPLYREMLKDGKSDFVEYAQSKGYDGVRFLSDDGSEKWIATAKPLKEAAPAANSIADVMKESAGTKNIDEAKQAHLERIRQADLTASKTLSDRTSYEAKKDDVVRKARVEMKLSSKESVLQKFSRWFKPLKALDPKTQDIYKDYASDKLLAKAVANEELAKYDKPKKSDMQSIYDYQAGKKSDYNTQVKKNFDALFKEANQRGLETRYRENYVPQVYADKTSAILSAAKRYLTDLGMKPDMIGDYLDGKPIPSDVATGLKITPTFERARFFPDYKTAEKYGLTPKYQNIPALQAYYREQMERALAGQRFVQQLVENGKLVPDTFKKPSNYEPVTTRFSQMQYYAEPKLAQMLNDMFRDEEHLNFPQWTISKTARISRLAQEIAVSSGVPGTDIHLFSAGQAIASLTRALGSLVTLDPGQAASDVKTAWAMARANFTAPSLAYFKANAKYLPMMAEEGINLGDHIASYGHAYENTARNSMWSKVLGAGGDTFHKVFTEKTFGSMLPQMYTQVFKDTYEGALKKGLDEAEASKLAGETTKATFGMMDDVGRGKTAQDTLSTLFFAPKFRETLINTWLNAAKGFTTEFRNPAFARSRSLIVGSVMMFALYQYLNKKISGQYTWQNENGHEFDLRIPMKDDQFMYIPFMPSMLAFPRNIAEAGINAAKGDFSTATQKASSVFSQPIKTTFEVLSNHDYFDNPIYKPTDTTFQKTSKIAEYIGVNNNHPYVKALVEQIQNKKPLYQSIVTALQLPATFKSLSQIQQQQFYDALAQQQTEHARDVERVKPIYDEVQQLISAGKSDEAQKKVDALSDTDYAIYKSIKATAARAATTKAEVNMTQTVNQVQALKKAGKLDEAQAIVDKLSDSEYKSYTLAKKRMGVQ